MRLDCIQLDVTFNTDTEPVYTLSDVSFQTREREFLSIVGPSGCGKTTLLRVLAGLLSPQKGVIDWIPSTTDRSSRVLLVSQERNLFPWMTVLENAAFGLEMQGITKQERESRAVQLLQRFGLSGREKAYPHELSLGMKQRVAVVRAFVSEPAVLLMDEPFAALDFQTRLTLQRELLDLWEQEHKSVLFVTHDIDEAILLSDRILILSSRPARVIRELTVKLPRPRATSVTFEESFLDLKREVLGRLGLSGDDRPSPVGVTSREPE